MDTYYTIEEKYLQAVDEIAYGEAPKGLQLLNEIIANDPFYARAHYQLGMIYYYNIKDYQTAGFHFKTCCELEPSFPDVYYHYLHLVVFLNMHNKVTEIAQKALAVPGVDASAIHDLTGLYYEKNRNWTNALKYYRDAFFEVTGKDERGDIEASIARVKMKIRESSYYQYNLAD